MFSRFQYENYDMHGQMVWNLFHQVLRHQHYVRLINKLVQHCHKKKLDVTDAFFDDQMPEEIEVMRKRDRIIHNSRRQIVNNVVLYTEYKKPPTIFSSRKNSLYFFALPVHSQTEVVLCLASREDGCTISWLKAAKPRAIGPVGLVTILCPVASGRP